MDDHYAAFKEIIDALDPMAADFAFYHFNLRNAVQIPAALTQMEKRELSSRLQELAMRPRD